MKRQFYPIVMWYDAHVQIMFSIIAQKQNNYVTWIAQCENLIISSFFLFLLAESAADMMIDCLPRAAACDDAALGNKCVTAGAVVCRGNLSPA